MSSTSPKHPLANCHVCPLKKRDCVFADGPADAPVVIVSRSPGRYDAERRKPFAGPSGQVLDHLLELYGYSREDVLVTNVVLCETSEVPKDAIAACSQRLTAEIANADTIIAAGAEAAALIAKKTVTSGRGFVHERTTTTGKKQRVIVTNNPAVVLRESDNFPNLVEDFKLALDPPPSVQYPSVTLLTDERSISEFLSELTESTVVAADIEGHSPHIECIGISRDTSTIGVITRRGIESAFGVIKAFLEREDIKFVWHNGIYDVKVLKENDINARIDHDTFALSYLLDERPGTHSLAYLARLHLGWPNYEPESVEKFKDTGVLPENMDEFYDYNGKDVAATLLLYEHLRPKLEDEKMEWLYETHYVPFFNALTDIHRRGWLFDAHRAADINEEIVLPKLRDLRKQLGELAGHPLYNPNSTPQTQAIVYGEWGLKHGLKDRGKKKFSTSFDKDVRREVIEGRFECKPRVREKLIEFAALTNVYREIDTQRGTFIEGLIKRTSKDSRLYGDFNPCGTVTGRTSSRNPNFQNITRQARDVVPGIRTLFLPSPGNLVIQADYSQAELRCIAKFSDDDGLLAIYRDSHRSLHKETASAFYGENYTSEQYVRSKNINFGVCYGQSAAAFAQMYTMPKAEAQAYIDEWFKRFPAVLNWIGRVQHDAVNETVVIAPIGRRRRFHLVTQDNLLDVQREAVNFLPQTLAAFFTIAALIELNNDHGVPVISTVHDSIIADVPEDEVRDVALLMKSVMEEIPGRMLPDWADIPFKVDISVGETWGDVVEYAVELVGTSGSS